MAAASRATLTGTRSGLQSMFANLRLACPVTVGARSPPLSGALLARSALQTGAAAHCAVLKVGGAAWRSSSPGMAAACGGAQHLGARSISSTRPRAAGLNDFFVSFPEVDKDGKPMFPAAGRAWTAAELRQKSFEDLHKLWWILLKERNSLAVERHAARARSLQIPNPRRIRKVRKSMSRIMCVLGERKRMKALIRSQEVGQ